jgi:hypothetical protein
VIRYQASSQAEARGWLGLFVGKSVLHTTTALFFSKTIPEDYHICFFFFQNTVIEMQ